MWRLRCRFHMDSLLWQIYVCSDSRSFHLHKHCPWLLLIVLTRPAAAPRTQPLHDLEDKSIHTHTEHRMNPPTLCSQCKCCVLIGSTKIQWGNQLSCCFWLKLLTDNLYYFLVVCSMLEFFSPQRWVLVTFHEFSQKVKPLVFSLQIYIC